MQSLILATLILFASQSVMAAQTKVPDAHAEECARFLKMFEAQALVVDERIQKAFAQGEETVPILVQFGHSLSWSDLSATLAYQISFKMIEFGDHESKRRRPLEFYAFQQFIDNIPPDQALALDCNPMLNRAVGVRRSYSGAQECYRVSRAHWEHVILPNLRYFEKIRMVDPETVEAGPRFVR